MAPKNGNRRLLLPKEIFELLEKEVGFYQNLLELLDKERECLYGLSIEDLCAVSKAKETEILKIKVVEQTLKDTAAGLLRDYGYDAENISISSLMEVAGKEQREVIKDYLSVLGALKEDIRERNSINKRSIEATLECIEDSLSILLPCGNSAFYTRQGKNRRSSCNASVLSREV